VIELAQDIPDCNVLLNLTALTAQPPALFLPHPKAAERFFDFFAANIRNKVCVT
jgi:hypothetical protein